MLAPREPPQGLMLGAFPNCWSGGSARASTSPASLQLPAPASPPLRGAGRLGGSGLETGPRRCTGRPAVPGTRPPPCRVIRSGTEAQGVSSVTLRACP